MGVVVAGIDEAGYGPLLGPLTVAMCVLRLGEFEPGGPAPDFWRILSPAVCREARDKRQRIAIADSKKLKLPNDSASRHPLTHLERGVLAFAGQHGGEATPVPATDADLLARVGAAHSGRAWYAGPPTPLPLGRTGAEIALDVGMLRAALRGAGVEVLALRCIVVDEAVFNDIVRRTGTKGEATLHAIGRHLRWLRETLGAGGASGEPGGGMDHVRIVCDRLGGRTTYADLLERELPGVRAVPIEESARVSRYDLGDRWAAHFQPECEAAHLPVALASMTAKLVRELAMARFNRYFAARLPELKPTAGYRADAARWLRDASNILTAEERREMVRIT